MYIRNKNSLFEMDTDYVCTTLTYEIISGNIKINQFFTTSIPDPTLAGLSGHLQERVDDPGQRLRALAARRAQEVRPQRQPQRPGKISGALETLPVREGLEGQHSLELSHVPGVVYVAMQTSKMLPVKIRTQSYDFDLQRQRCKFLQRSGSLAHFLRTGLGGMELDP
jgi:hypothetical protein